MRSTLLLSACSFAGLFMFSSGTATAADHNAGALSPIATYKLGTPGVTPAALKDPSPGAAYSNLDNYLGTGFENQGAGTDPANPLNTITNLVADDLTPVTGGLCSDFVFSVINFNDHDVNARLRVRIYQDNGGVPGTAITGISFTLVNPLAAGSANLFDSGDLGALAFPIPNGKFWAGITFDNNGGTSGATTDDLNQLGQAISDPPSLGSSANLCFETASQGSWFSDNPPGSTFSFGGANPPPANFAWEFVVPEPASLSLMGLAVVGMLARRR
jgi:hypothetical protein